MRSLAFAALLSLTATALTAQQPVHLSFPQADPAAHRLTPYPRLHAATTGLPPQDRFLASICLQLTISINGRVDKAVATDGPKDFRERAVALAREQTFTPFKVKGRTVPVVVDDSVLILPPEEWLPTHRSLPAQIDMRTLSFSLERTGCLGTCPGYVVTVHGDGTVDYTGGYYVLVPGKHVAHLAPAAVQALLSQFRRADFLSAKPSYRAAITDNPSETLTLRFNGQMKEVVDYVGPQVGMPDAIEDLELAVDRASNSARWVSGNSDTLPSLRAEHYDFASASLPNRQFYAEAANRNLAELLDVFLAARTPWNLPKGGSDAESAEPGLYLAPICAATGSGNLDAVRRMLEQKLPLTPRILHQCMAAAAGGDHVALVNLWVSHGAHRLPMTHRH